MKKNVLTENQLSFFEGAKRVSTFSIWSEKGKKFIINERDLELNNDANLETDVPGLISALKSSTIAKSLELVGFIRQVTNTDSMQILADYTHIVICTNTSYKDKEKAIIGQIEGAMPNVLFKILWLTD